MKARQTSGSVFPHRASTDTGILERLRAGTRAAHASIECTPALKRLLEPDLAVVEYVEALRRLQVFHEGVAADLRLCLFGRSMTDVLLDGARLAAIEEDLAWFGVPALPSQRLQPQPTDIAAALGVLYVIEGSNMGGRVVGRHVAKSLGVTPGCGGSFHCGLTPEDMQWRWGLLKEALNAEVEPCVPAWETVVDAALTTFGSLESWMRGIPEPHCDLRSAG